MNKKKPIIDIQKEYHGRPDREAQIHNKSSAQEQILANLKLEQKREVNHDDR